MDLLWRGTSVGRETIGDVGGGGSIGYGVMGGGGARGGDDKRCSSTFWELLMLRTSLLEICDTPISLKM